MKHTPIIALALLAGSVIAGAASAQTVNAVITADNHYTLFTGNGGGLTLIGGGETGAGGAPGTYNWSLPESYTFPAGEFLYIAAWSDGAVAQGVLAQIDIDGTPLHSGDPAWQVFRTNLDRGNGDPYPTVGEMLTQIGLADGGNKWETPHVGGNNGIAPWGTVAGITNQAKWMWCSVDGDNDPLNGGSNAGEYLIFRVPVPAPSAAAAFGLAGLVASRRRRG